MGGDPCILSLWSRMFFSYIFAKLALKCFTGFHSRVKCQGYLSSSVCCPALHSAFLCFRSPELSLASGY